MDGNAYEIMMRKDPQGWSGNRKNSWDGMAMGTIYFSMSLLRTQWWQQQTLL